ncbi:phage tail protein [Lacticaseibacillus paracasei]|uniref:distal tail protein Dit n=1 Tax=Lacticaseibacillus paracasei TaxID=1597 RepID=UPI000BBDA2BC|nr:distal tail protein Dit [Lacticaseibacillus paracasei]PCL24484.1 phage tail protein [Lacticaseibacillus paracasei]PCL35291.1 phage tail protein [Lacticaseibacillus paracasei]
MANLIFGGHKIGSSSLQFSAARGVFSEVENTTQPVGAGDGEMLIRSRLKSRIIPVTYDFVALSRREFERQLAPLLYSTDVQKLIIDDRPDEFWYAKVDGKIDMDRAYFLGTGTINFLIPDGIAHSVATKTADNMPYKDMPVNLLTGTSGPFVMGFGIPDTAWDTTNQVSGISLPVTTTYPEVVPQGTGFPYKYMPGVTYTQSIYISTDAPLTGTPISFSWYTDNYGHNTVGAANLVKLSTNVYRATGTLTWPSSNSPDIVRNYDFIYLAQVFDFTKGTFLQFYKPKLEQEPTASPWSPNPADPEYYANTITVHNGGTYPVEPVITATMHADNGLIAFINSQGGVLQFGNPEEADGVERKRSEVARYEGFDKEPAGAAYNIGQTNSHYYYISSQKNVMEGSVKYADDDGSAVEPVFLPTNSYYWEGPSLHLKTTNASDGSNTKSFIAKWRYKFNSSVNALGAIEMTLDNDTGVAYQVIIRSNYAGKDDIDVQVFAGSTLVFQQTLNRSVFANGRYYEAKLTKLGNTLNLQLAGIVQGGIKPSEVVTRNPPLIMPPIMLTSDEASLPITGATLWFQRFENYPYPDMGVYDMDIEWLNVDYWTDLSNRFSAGDVVTIDVANRQILVNGVINADLQLIDNDWKKFKLLPGDTQILTQRSSWAQPYEVEVAFREAFL